MRTLLLDKNVQKPNVIDIGDFFLFAYENHSPLYINKTTGRIYSKDDSLTQRIDSIRLLRILNFYHLVEGFKRFQKHPRNRTIPFLEETEGKEKEYGKCPEQVSVHSSPFLFLQPQKERRKFSWILKMNG
jgi:hypothetical protein